MDSVPLFLCIPVLSREPRGPNAEAICVPEQAYPSEQQHLCCPDCVSSYPAQDALIAGSVQCVQISPSTGNSRAGVVLTPRIRRGELLKLRPRAADDGIRIPAANRAKR